MSLVSGVVLREVVRASTIGVASLTANHEDATAFGSLALFLAFAAANAVAIIWRVRTAARAAGAE